MTVRWLAMSIELSVMLVLAGTVAAAAADDLNAALKERHRVSRIKAWASSSRRTWPASS